MTWQHNIIRQYVKLVLKEGEMSVPNDELLEIISNYVDDPSNLGEEDNRKLAQWLSKQRLTVPGRLERIERRFPDEFVNGRIVDFLDEVRSFSRTRFSSDEHAGHIAWKSSDRCILVIDHATRGWAIDYGLIGQHQFDATTEREVLVTGRYRIIEHAQIVEPGTYSEYGYRIPLIRLEEY